MARIVFSPFKFTEQQRGVEKNDDEKNGHEQNGNHENMKCNGVNNHHKI
jgi:hypothetical protein